MMSNGGTLRLRYNRDVIGWPLLACSRCEHFFKKHYYVHQCETIPHHWCYRCIADAGTCARCNKPVKRIFKSGYADNWSRSRIPRNTTERIAK